MYKFVISGADTLVAKNSPLFWEMTECGLLYRYQGFGVACWLHFQYNQRRYTDFSGEFMHLSSGRSMNRRLYKWGYRLLQNVGASIIISELYGISDVKFIMAFMYLRLGFFKLSGRYLVTLVSCESLSTLAQDVKVLALLCLSGVPNKDGKLKML
jgi:hypothetical protein